MVWKSRGSIPSSGRKFSLHHHIHISSGAHPDSYPIGIMESFLGGKATGAES